MASPFNMLNWYWDVVDTNHGTHVYSTASNAFVLVSNGTYLAWLAAGLGNTPTVIDTLVNLRKVFDSFAQSTWTATTQTTSGASDVVLANPAPARVSITITTGVHIVVLPRMDTPIGIPIGVPMEIRNDGAISFGLYQQDGTTFIGTLGPADIVTVVLSDNSTANGTLLITSEEVRTSRGTWAVRGLSGANTAATPNTKMDFTNLEFIKRNSVGATRYGTGFGSTCTIDCGAAGPVANGRDQSGVFTASQWLHFYAISASVDGSGIMTGLVSTVAPPTAPTLPTGYLFRTYLCSVYWDASSHLLPVTVRGNFVAYTNAVSTGVALNAGAATSETTAAITALVPPVATKWDAFLQLVADAGGSRTANFYTTSGTIFMTMTAPASARSGLVATLVNTQYFAYLVSNASAAAYCTVNGYCVPNGDS